VASSDPGAQTTRTASPLTAAPGRAASAWLLAAAILNGAVIMAVELLGARMLSPVFGGSLTVWAAMISVTMLSLAVGYFAGGWLADRRPRPALVAGLLLAAAALAALWRAWRERDRGALVAAALPLALFALGARRSRYLIPVFPMIALLAARGLDALPGRARRFAALAAVGFSLVTVFAVYLPFLAWVNTANLQAAGRFLDEHGAGTAEVTALPAPGVAINPEVAVPLLDYHTAARIVVRSPARQPPPPEELEASSFRFTWEQRLPPWYRDGAPAHTGAAQVLIAGDPDAEIPPELALKVGGRPPDGVFARDAIFRYRTHVYVWLAPAN